MTEHGRPLMTLCVEVGGPLVVDAGMPGRRFIPITGGTVSEGLSGRVLAGGGDWQTLLPDGRLEISARYVLQIDGHGPVEVQSDGVRHGPPAVLEALARGERVDASAYYFRTAMRFRTAAPGLARLNALLAFSIGEREADRVHLRVIEIT